MAFNPPFYDDETANHIKIGEIINSYMILSSYLEEPQYIIYFAEKIQEKRKVTLKFLKLIKSRIDKIQEEIQILQETNNPNIEPLEQVFRYNEYLCLVFPYIYSQNVSHLLKTRYSHGIPEYLAANIFNQMLNGINYIHSQNICHNDISCSMFLEARNEDTKIDIYILTGFTFSFVSFPESVNCIFSGAPSYMAPEKIKREPFGLSADIWSLGISLFEMLTGQLPITQYNLSREECINAILSGKLNYQLLIDAKVSESVIDLIRSMCQIDPQ